MAKRKLTSEQYQELKKFLGFFSIRYMGLQEDTLGNKLIVAFDDLEKSAPARAADGLVMVINDCIEMSCDWTREKVAALDAELKKRSLITLTDLRYRYSRQYARVVKRARISNDEEYYLLKGVVDGGSLELSADEKIVLDKMIEAYENLEVKKA